MIFSKNRHPFSHCVPDTHTHTHTHTHNAEFYIITRLPATRWVANFLVELSAKQEVNYFHIPVEKKAENYI